MQSFAFSVRKEEYMKNNPSAIFGKKFFRLITSAVLIAVALACLFAIPVSAEDEPHGENLDCYGTDGNNDHRCDVCGEMVSYCEYGEWKVVTAPTLTKKGSVIRTCKLNETHAETKELPRLSNQYGYSVKPYYILELERDGEEYGIYFPSYELPTFESLTLLHAENPDDKADEEK